MKLDPNFDDLVGQIKWFRNNSFTKRCILWKGNLVRSSLKIRHSNDSASDVQLKPLTQAATQKILLKKYLTNKIF
jgi:hypothetical protein